MVLRAVGKKIVSLANISFVMLAAGFTTPSLASKQVEQDLKLTCSMVLDGFEFSNFEYLEGKHPGRRGVDSRLLAVIPHLSSKDFNSLFSTLEQSDFEELIWALRVGNSERLPRGYEILIENEQIKNFILDLYYFNRSNRGLLFNSTDAYHAVLEELHENKNVSKPEIKKTRSSNIATDGINRTLEAVLKRSLDEYDGQKFGNTGLLRRLKRFIFPLYKRVKKVINHGQTQNKRVHLIATVDQIMKSDGLDRQTFLNLSAEEQQELSAFITDTPSQLEAVSESMRNVYGFDVFANGKIDPNKLDSYLLYKKVEKLSISNMQADNQREAEAAVNVLDATLNRARARTGLPKRTAKDYSPLVLQIRSDQGVRQDNEIFSVYMSWTSQSANVSYTVEDRHTERYPCGTDKDGKTEYCTRTYYTTRTVTPSMEDILSGSFDTGDRFVNGLDSIKAATSTLTSVERVYRKKSHEIDVVISNLYENYAALMRDGKKSETLAEVEQYLRELEDLIPQAENYANYTDTQIVRQWRRDNINNFRERNKHMLSRLKNIQWHLLILKEIISKDLSSPGIEYLLEDYSEGLDALRRIMYWNYGYKFILGGSAAGSSGMTAYYYQNPWIFEQHKTLVIQTLTEWLEVIPF